ncbi:MAG TPA: TIGR03118 family protein, partial [Anaeromyxobacter sp.]|nr:TIGR03118 family protein [Anaeromyxobacter sp.]
MNRNILSAVVISACVLSSDAWAAASDPQGGLYVQRNLVSNGAVAAEHVDANLLNAWGITHRGTSPWWVSDNGAGVSTLYDGEGVAQFGTPPLVVSVTGAGGGAAAP